MKKIYIIMPLIMVPLGAMILGFIFGLDNTLISEYPITFGDKTITLLYFNWGDINKSGYFYNLQDIGEETITAIAKIFVDLPEYDKFQPAIFTVIEFIANSLALFINVILILPVKLLAYGINLVFAILGMDIDPAMQYDIFGMIFTVKDINVPYLNIPTWTPTPQ